MYTLVMIAFGILYIIVVGHALVVTLAEINAESLTSTIGIVIFVVGGFCFMRFISVNLEINEISKPSGYDVWIDEDRAYLLVDDGRAVNLLKGPGEYYIPNNLHKDKIYWKINNGGLISFYENKEVPDPFTIYLFEPPEGVLMVVAGLDLAEFDIIGVFNKLNCKTTECVLEIIRQMIRSMGRQDNNCDKVKKIFDKFNYLNIKVKEISFCW